VTSPAGPFAYTHLGARPAPPAARRLPNGASVTNVFDTMGRLTETRLRNSSLATLDLRAYAFDRWSQRTNALRTLTDNAAALSRIDYAYDAIGQAQGARAYEPDGATLRLHEHLGYAHDAANNLARRTNNAFTQSFTPDARNRLAAAARSGAYTVAGAANAPAVNVTINGQPAALYHDQTFATPAGVSLNNGANSFTVLAQDALDRWATNTLNTFLPATVTFAYDANGNLTNDGQRVFQYDDENQLTNVFVPGQWRSEFVYDGLFRRRVRREYTWTGGAWSLTNEVRYVHDGLLVLQERDGNNVPVLTYTRGLDLSGTMSGAGGIGGLLARTAHPPPSSGLSPSAASLYFHSDGGGNVTTLLNANQRVVARYHYDPFGNPLGMSGPLAEANRYRFSSKEWHPQSGLYHFGYRDYEPNLQRWLNEDPLGEAGGINLHRFVFNDPLGWIDPDGLAPARNGLPGGGARQLRNNQRRVRTQEERVYENALRSAREAELARRYPGHRSGDTYLGPAPPLPASQSKPAPCPPNSLSSRNAPPIVLGENMRDRVIPFAERHGFEYYRPGSPGTFEENLAANRSWLLGRLAEGSTVIEIGRDPLRPEPSPFYLMESSLVNQNAAPTISFGGF
jgi:RHS repeat-associated protein